MGKLPPDLPTKDKPNLAIKINRICWIQLVPAALNMGFQIMHMGPQDDAMSNQSWPNERLPTWGMQWIHVH
jgi:hypothetical protein